MDYTLRSHKVGDIGWVVYRHGTLYAEEYGWDERFEALVAGIMASFVQNFDATAERCWIAEQDGERIGCVFVVRKSADVAQLRCLIVEPRARGTGLGRRLVQVCLDFARGAGYSRMILWTNSQLHSARKLYEAAGFHLVSEERDDVFPDGSLAQLWELEL